MAGRHTFQGRQGELHLVDRDGNFVKVLFESMDLRAPLGKPRSPDPIAIHTHGFSFSPTSPDYDSGFYEPLQLDFSCSAVSSDYVKLLDAACNSRDLPTWTVNNVPWTSTKNRGSIIQPDNTYVSTGNFFDQRKVAIKIESLWTSSLSGSILGHSWDECYIAPQNLTITESADDIQIQISALVYGNISPITAFTSGTES